MKKSDVFRSKFLKPDDLGGKDTVLTIASTSYETLKDFKGADAEKLIVSFAETKKQLVINSTLWDNIAHATNEDDSDRWPNCQVEAFATTVIVNGESKPVVRIRAATQAGLKLPAQPQPKAAQRRPDKPDHDSDMDDQIPF